jgi:hypothetical protein
MNNNIEKIVNAYVITFNNRIKDNNGKESFNAQFSPKSYGALTAARGEQSDYFNVELIPQINEKLNNYNINVEFLKYGTYKEKIYNIEFKRKD